MDIKILENIRSIRKSKELKSITMAKKLKISQGYYSKLENGKISNWKDYIIPICTILEIDFNILAENFEINITKINKDSKMDLLNEIKGIYSKVDLLKEEIEKLNDLILINLNQ